MAAEAAVEVLHRKKLATAVGDERDELKQVLMAEHARLAGGPERAGVITATFRYDAWTRRS
jgi:hypothetical protein